MKSKENPKVDFYFQKEKKWQDEITKMRAIVLSCGLFTFQRSVDE